MKINDVQIDFSIWEKWQNFLKDNLLPIAKKIQIETVVEQFNILADGQGELSVIIDGQNLTMTVPTENFVELEIYESN